MTNIESQQNAAVRVLVQAFSSLPDTAIERLQYLQPEIGCFNGCGFCSQEAGTQVWQLDRESVQNLMTALGVVARSRGLRVAAGRVSHRPGVIFRTLIMTVCLIPIWIHTSRLR